MLSGCLTYLVVCFYLFLSIQLQAQVGKGFFVGGALAGQVILNPNDNNGQSPVNLNIELGSRFGYSFTQNWSVGLLASGNSSFRVGNSATRGYTVGLFSRYAWPIGMDGRLMLWGELNGRYGRASGNVLGSTILFSRSTVVASALSVGLLFFPHKKWAIDAGLGSVIKYEYKESFFNQSTILPIQVHNIYILNLGQMPLHVGVQYYFNR